VEKITGLIAAPFTPFTDKGLINYEVIDSYAEFLYSQKLSGVFINGTTGEGLSLTTEERIKIAECWVKHKRNDFKIIVHVGSTSIKESEILVCHAEKTGAWGVGMQGPCFFKPTTVESLVNFCKAVASKAQNLPFYYYHMPVMTGINFKMVDFLKVADRKIPNLAGIKFTSEDLMDFQLCSVLFDGNYDMLYGRDEILLCSLALGAKGAVGSTYNFMPGLYLEMIDLYNKGDIPGARRLQGKSMLILNEMINLGNPIICGRILMSLHGIELGDSRLPFEPLKIDARETLLSKVRSIYS
jgi:N-acetylneuraminate lyase